MWGDNLTQKYIILPQGHKLKFNFLKGSDSGEYRCVGRNRGGRAEVATTLAVLEEGVDMTAVIAGSTTAAVVVILLLAVMLYYMRGLKRKVDQLCRSRGAKVVADQSFARCAS